MMMRWSRGFGWWLLTVAMTLVVVGGEEGQLIDSGDQLLLVTTHLGSVKGKTQVATKGKEFYGYYGIPFAQPPVGELRLKDPVPASAWEGTLDATSHPPNCIQVSMMSFMESGASEVKGQEDCLYLNVFRPKDSDVGDRLPVLVYIHGGAFYGGSAKSYEPHVLMNLDIILVVIQYRLAVLGFLSTEDDVIPGNFGLKDQTLALAWVQENIAYFGGDSKKVTIMGESAGSASVHYQILTPASEGLFAQAILQSGSALNPSVITKNHKEISKIIGAPFGCSLDNGGSEEFLRCLQQVDAQDLTPSYAKLLVFMYLPMVMGPRVDGHYLPADAAELLKEGRFKGVPIIAGITQHEGGMFAAPIFENESVMKSLVNDFDIVGPVTLALEPPSERDYLALTHYVYRHFLGDIQFTEENADNITQMYSGRHFSVGHDLMCGLHARLAGQNGGHVYRYELQHKLAISFLSGNTNLGKHWVSHGEDLNFLFQGGEYQFQISTDEDYQLRDIWLQLYYNFITTGNPTPNTSMGFTWAPSSESDLSYLALTTRPTMHPYDQDRQQILEFWKSLPIKLNLILHPEKISPLTQDFKHNADGMTPTKAEL